MCYESESLTDKDSGRGLKMMYELLIGIGRKRVRKGKECDIKRRQHRFYEVIGLGSIFLMSNVFWYFP